MGARSRRLKQPARRREREGHWCLGMIDWYPAGDGVFLLPFSSCECLCLGEGRVGRQVPLYPAISVAMFSTEIWVGLEMWCPEEERKQASLAYTGWVGEGEIISLQLLSEITS